MTDSNISSADTKIVNLISKSSLEYADHLFLDNSLFADSYKVSADSYTCDDFPGSDIVKREIVFGSPGYNQHPLPFIEFSYLGFVLGICSFVLIPVNIFILMISKIISNFIVFYGFNIFLGLFSAMSLFFCVSALHKPPSRFFNGRKHAKIGLIFSSLGIFFFMWMLLVL